MHPWKPPSARSSLETQRFDRQNCGSGQSWSVEDIIRGCFVAAGVTKPFRERGEVRSNEIMDVVADIRAIELAVGWRPRTALERGIAGVVKGLMP